MGNCTDGKDHSLYIESDDGKVQVWKCAKCGKSWKTNKF